MSEHDDFIPLDEAKRRHSDDGNRGLGRDAEEAVVRLVQEAAGKPIILDPRDPLPSARTLVETRYTRNGQHTLHHHVGMFYAWSGTCYPALDDATIRAEVWHFLETAKRYIKKNKVVPFQPNRAKVGDVLDAVRAVSNLPASVSAPAWLGNAAATAPSPKELLPCANGLLHLPTLELEPPTPAFFTHNALDFAYDPDALDPEDWLKFLDDLWGDDPKAIDTLQELFGYFLVPDTRQQKIFLIVGPKRSGKGTIARVVTGLLGQANVVAPTLASLAGNFGLAALIDKPLAIIADARLGSRADQHAIAERLLSVSGEDGLTVDRKYLPPWTGRLPTRFVVLTNELPRLADASGALASRFVVLTLTESFYDREDHNLTDRLLRELPGILNWSIEGWQRLQKRGHFIQPRSSADAIEALEALSSPVTAFVRDCCEVGPGNSIECAHLFEAWRQWCTKQGRDRPGTAQSFGRDLSSAFPAIKVKRPRDGHGGKRPRRYEGIDLQYATAT